MMLVVWILLPLLAMFLAVILVRAALFVPGQEAEETAETVDADADQLGGHLQAMIRLKTISYAEEERMDQEQFRQFRALLRQLYPTVFERCRVERLGRNGMLLCLPGQNADKPSVLMAHYDVVPVDETLWSVPPFDGVIRDGELWGRGAIDTKCTVLCLMEAAEALLKRGFKPRNDLYLSFGGDEETLGQDTAAIVDMLESRGVRPAFVLDEGGAVVSRVFPGVTKSAALVGIAEKGSVFMDIIARGKGGHASAPPARQAVGILSHALLRLLNRPLPFTLTEPARGLFDTLGRHSTFAYKLIFANLWCFAPLLDRICRSSGGELDALVRTTIALTRLSAAEAYNVLPGEAEAGVNIRLISGDSMETARARMERIIDDPQVQVKIIKGSEPSSVSLAEGEPWERLKRAIRQTYPEAIVSPYLMVAASDSRHYCRISDRVYRFSGFPLSREQLGFIHNQDERIPLKLLPDAQRFFMRVMAQC